MQSKKHDSLVDCLKGIGIISVVIGHSGKLLPFMTSNITTAFVYLYHLMIFFFASGMLYRPDNHQDPYLYLGKQLRSSVPVFVGYNLTFLTFHNFFSYHQLLDIAPYTKNDFIIQGLSVLALKHTETITGTLWFIPMFLFAKAFFVIGFHVAERFKYKRFVHAIHIIICMVLGLYTSNCGMELHFNMQTALLGVPIMYLGYWFKQNRTKLHKFLNPVTCFVSAACMICFINQKIGYIDLVKNEIISPILFFPITGLGLIFSVSLAEGIRQVKLCARVVSYVGSVSIHIMALHFFTFKCFDWLCALTPQIDKQTAMVFPIAFNGIGWLYTIIGVGVPTILIFIARKLKDIRAGDKTFIRRLS